jgi:S-adenosylmethionine/arginine decarboxylase-like enzyme
MTSVIPDAARPARQASLGRYWGYHLILDCRGGDLGAIRDRRTIVSWARSLVERIDMRAHGEPVCEHFATHDPEAAGYSLVQLIETSSITGHFVDGNGDAYIDVFSCKPFDIDTVRAVVQQCFRPATIRVTYLTRQA